MDEDAFAVRDVQRQSRGKSLVKIALEVVLISAGVFLGLAGEQWRENSGRREQAAATLRRFRSEIATNRTEVAKVKDYHAATRTQLNAFLKADAKERKTLSVNLEGIQIVSFEHTAWDLALATQSLADVDPELAFALSRLYNAQQAQIELTRGLTQAMYLRPPSENVEAFIATVALYYDDVVLIEPKLIQMYDEILPRIDQMLGESAAR